VTSAIGLDPRVTGAQRYAVDVERPAMLYAAFVRSPHAHARAGEIDASALPDGCTVITHADVSRLGPYGCQVRDQRVLTDIARFAGDIVAAVAAPSEVTARAAARAVQVEWQELPAVFDPVEAVGPSAPLVHQQAAASASEAVSIDVRPIEGSNVCHRFRIRQGDAASALAGADVVVVSAGSSFGARDETAAAVAALGPPGIWCHGLAIKPGKPTLLAECDGVPVIGLPGNPRSALVVFRLVGMPIVRRAGGCDVAPAEPTTRARLARDLPSAAGRLDVVQVRVRDGVAIPLFGASALLSVLTAADGYVVIDEPATGLAGGTEVDVTLYG
jgi:hypothetical protein